MQTQRHKTVQAKTSVNENFPNEAKKLPSKLKKMVVLKFQYVIITLTALQPEWLSGSPFATRGVIGKNKFDWL